MQSIHCIMKMYHSFDKEFYLLFHGGIDFKRSNFLFDKYKYYLKLSTKKEDYF